jgi:ABC-2 type transport system permease protein
MMLKELIQMRRDRLTFGMMLGVPVLQLLLFGYAINTDPQHLPTALQIRDHSPFARSFVAAMENTRYFEIIGKVASEAEADAVLDRGEAMFVVTVPEDFSSDLIRGERPELLVEVDATDPVAAGNAVGALNELARTALARELDGPLASLRPGEGPFELVLHRRYNPERITAYNVVPALLGVILTMTMVLMTALAVTREAERGTMENLLAMPLRPAEVMLGKILPYVAVGYVQVAVVLLAARYLFGVPMLGSLALLSVALLAFIGANLAVGFTFSTLARNQLQAMQLTFFFFLPSILLSGFMFPFAGMPGWARAIGELLPLTHFLRVVRGVLLKGNGPADIWPSIWPLLLFMAVVSAVALKRYRQTLD